ncbi:MAG: ABC transporter permease subunit [Desulfobulbaceae bacterium]|jgi:microcin C transport system permease protein|nr:ABC transporter permease subunit [Desulfobulbaceae bacterium]
MIPTIFGIMVITFTVTQFVPGGPVERMIAELESGSGQGGEVTAIRTSYQGNKGLDADKIERIRQTYGFDKPPLTRFFTMMKNYLVFDLGESYYHHASVTSLIVSKLPVSMSLGFWSFLITYGVCIPLGIKKAVRDGTSFDFISSTLILVGYAIPGFVLAVLLIVFFAGGNFLNIFPLRNLVSDNFNELPVYKQVLDYLWHMVLPIISMSVSSLAMMTLLTKNCFLEEMHKQYVTTARAKGVSENKILYGHIFRNAIIPLITGFPGAFIMAFFTGSLLIETIFSLDGMGLLSYQSILNRDYPVVLGTLYFFSVLGLIARLLSDISYVLVNPRITFDASDN